MARRPCGKKYEFPFFSPSPHERSQAATYNEWCESLRQKKTHQATACLLVQWLCCCPPPSLPCFAPEPTWQALCADLFLNCFWFLCGTSCRGAQSREQRQDVRWLCQLCPAPHILSGTKYRGSLIHQISQLLPKRVCICPWVRGGKKKQQKNQKKNPNNKQTKTRKKKERKRKDQSVNCKTSCGARWK